MESLEVKVEQNMLTLKARTFQAPYKYQDGLFVHYID